MTHSVRALNTVSNVSIYNGPNDNIEITFWEGFFEPLMDTLVFMFFSFSTMGGIDLYFCC